MKLILALLSIAICYTGFSEEDLRSRIEYTIKSEKKDKTVPSGKTKIIGIAFIDGVPKAGIRVSSINHKKYAITNEKGEYSFLINSSDTSLYAHQINCGEVIIPSHKFKSGYTTEIHFYLQNANEIRVVKKPVIYLYSKEETTVNLRLKTKGELSFTYPQILNNNWEVRTNNDGIITHEGKTYPYLFWEVNQATLNFSINEDGSLTGYHIKTDSCISFLENTLTSIGLNQKEQTDFITFWGPQLQQQAYTTIQFLIDEDYTTEVAELTVSPTPKNIKRVYMLYKSHNILDEYQTIKRPKFSPVNRTGLTLIEWGGSATSSNTL